MRVPRRTLLDQVGASQREDPQIVEIMDKLIRGEASSHLARYSIDDKGWLRRDGRLCVPMVEDLVRRVLEEAHRSKLTIHPGGDKMYKDMKRIFFWPGMKKDVAEFVTEFIRQIRDEYDLTVFMIEHHMDLVMEISDRIYVLDFGMTIAEGTPELMQNNKRVIDAYLGVDEDA